jgi:hypothetical protein
MGEYGLAEFGLGNPENAGNAPEVELPGRREETCMRIAHSLVAWVSRLQLCRTEAGKVWCAETILTISETLTTVLMNA